MLLHGRRGVLAAVGLVVALAAGIAAWRAGTSGPTEPLRTRHLNPDGTPRYTNRLAREASPYLRQHAHNPVDWYPWGEEALARARAERKPILLSVGYSTCHWCHVMEEESFEDDEIAALLNARYVAIKVDREERPDLDAVYMNAVQLMTGGGGGWPMTLWLTPDGRPFYAGTYFPPRAGGRGQPIGFLELCTRLADVWAQDPTRVEEAAADVAERLRAAAPPAPTAASGADALVRAWAELAPTFDAEHGGFGTRPKFPQPSVLRLLLRAHARTRDPAPLDMAVRTLDAIAAGGVHDHVAGGFHRYAVDAAWRVPHFEKMLYDNALLAIAYLEAARAAGRRDFDDVARTTLAWLARDMQAPTGGFFAGSDADSEGEEGKYFRWTADEVAAAVGPAHARLALAWFDVGTTATTLATPRPLDAVAAEVGMAPDAARRALDDVRTRLAAARSRRVPPHVDRKVVTAWNGLALSAFARAAGALDDAGAADVARRTARTILAARRDGRLPRYLIDGAPHGAGYLDDHAFFEAGLLDLYEATGEVEWLDAALAVQRTLDERFADPQGGYFLTAAGDETLLTREKPDWDGAEPSGNSVALENLLRLHELTTDDALRARADALAAAFGTLLARRPSAVPHMVGALDFAVGPVLEIVLVSPAGRDRLAPFDAALAARFLPRRVVATVTGGAAPSALATRVPLVAEKTALGGAPTAYVCRRRVCALPTSDPAVFAAQLDAP